MTHLRRYTFKLYPNRTQEAALVRQASLLAALWNAALEQRERAYGTYREPSERDITFSHPWPFTNIVDGKAVPLMANMESVSLSWYDQKLDGKHIRADDPEFAAMSASSMEICLLALDDAFKAFFKRAKAGAGAASGYPRYKSPFAIEHKGADCTIWHREHRKGWRLDKAGKHYRVYAKGIPGTIKARGKFPVEVDDLTLRDMRLIRVGGVWQCSIVVKMEARRSIAPGAPSATIEFNLIDEFATVKTAANGQCLPGWETDSPSVDERILLSEEGVTEQSGHDSPDLGDVGRRQLDFRVDRHGHDSPDLAGDHGAVDALQSERDTRYKKFSCRWRREKRRIAKLKAREARRRKEALHLWTTKLIASVSDLTVVCPPIREATRSARGTEKDHGAAVKAVAMLNRHVLAQAPAMAIQMLEYKAAEAGLPPIVRINPDEHALAVGRELPAATKAVRKARRTIRKQKEILHV